ncbi:MAG TPA: methylenetetrahydrofolate reductase [Dongiaceae bacterium]|jgi:5,10-methylenetetrahydrofolate reductase|nr:methylenetetrahydrofolate reductase [Dongiaceae bacterium]
MPSYFDPAAPLPPLPGHVSDGRLERVLRSGRFAVTAELNPPDSADPREVYERALVLSEICDAINATDASGAHVHMSSVGICALLTRAGYAVVLQISGRDRNRIAIQGDVLGAAAMGVQNVLCLTGDGVQVGDQPEAKPVFDFDSTAMLNCLRTMRDRGTFLSGRKLTVPPRIFIGAAANPFAPPYEYRPLHLAKKIAAGADFIQTQYCFDVPRLRQFMTEVRRQGLHEKAFLLIGVGPLASARTAKWMRANVPGVHIPDAIIARLEGARDQKAEGKRLCIDLIQEISEIEGVAGIHMMAYRQEEFVNEIVQASGIMRNRQPRGNPAQPAQTEENS